jgi:glutamate N-acetyltransferase / amino-acid N-acetyltransferase
MKFLSNPKITDAKGFVAAAAHVGFKKRRKDICLIKSQVPAICSVKFTRNRVKAAPVVAGMATLEKSGHRLQALIINSGNANAGTGTRGMRDVRDTVAQTARLINVPKELILASSTGVIGHYLDMKKMKDGLLLLSRHLTPEGGSGCAEAILTTDTVEKSFAVRLKIQKKTVTLCGITKGSGMIQPDMATTLAFVTTDAAIDHALLDELFTDCVNQTYNMITVDGHTSTNDTALIMANGMAGNKPIRSGSKEAGLFQEALMALMAEMAQSIVRDGEGATKFVSVAVNKVRNLEEARRMAFAIANSPLVKTAIFGEDPNWGRILSAAGMVGVDFNPDRANLKINGRYIYRRGNPVALTRQKMKRMMAPEDIYIVLEVFTGRRSAVVYTSDLSYQYVRINAEYHT